MTVDEAFSISPGLLALDDAAFLGLLNLAGPTDAPELMRRLLADLGNVAVGLTAGLATADQDALRHQSHILLAIAGTIGAQQIHHLARRLNTVVKDGPRAAAAPLAVDLLPRLDALIERLRKLSAELGLER